MSCLEPAPASSVSFDFLYPSYWISFGRGRNKTFEDINIDIGKHWYIFFYYFMKFYKLNLSINQENS